MTIGHPVPALGNSLLQLKLAIQASPKVPDFTVTSTFVDQQVLRVGNLKFDDLSTLLFTSLDFPWVAIYADHIILNGAGAIGRQLKFSLDGDDGIDGVPAAPTPPFAGANGFQGGDGSPGQPGKYQPVPTFYLFCKAIEYLGNPLNDSLSMNFDGYDGGDGGAGSAGGNGGDGNDGTPAENDWSGLCGRGVGYGGRGGDIGYGGAPGLGGNGSDGAPIYVFVSSAIVNDFAAMSYSNKGGKKGKNGKVMPNTATPGRGGNQGPNAGTSCGSEPDRKGQPGQYLHPCGLPNEVGGRNGKASEIGYIISPYDNFTELDLP